MNGHIRTASATVVVLFSVLAMSPLPVHAQAACFSAFNGTVFFVFNISGATVDHRVVSPLSGRVSGTLSACAGLSEWPVVGSAILNASGTQATLAFRSFTVDAAGCGATDNIVALTLPVGSGTLQMNNVRSNFSNTTTLNMIPCSAAPASEDGSANGVGLVPRGTVDVLGNVLPE
jgi:hypothetical protein